MQPETKMTAEPPKSAVSLSTSTVRIVINRSNTVLVNDKETVNQLDTQVITILPQATDLLELRTIRQSRFVNQTLSSNGLATYHAVPNT